MLIVIVRFLTIWFLGSVPNLQLVLVRVHGRDWTGTCELVPRNAKGHPANREYRRPPPGCGKLVVPWAGRLKSFP